MCIVDHNEVQASHVVAFSLYGSNPRYVKGGLANIHAYREWFPEFTCRFYVSADIDRGVIRELREHGSEVFVMSGRGVDARFMFWRFLAADDPRKDRFLIRDIDSMASLRERRMYEQWIDSGRTYNVIRDHYSHAMRMMGGMWGGRCRPGFMAALLPRMWRYSNHYNRDQKFLTREVYPRIRDDVLVQDIVHRFPDEQVALQPVDEVDYGFIGEIATDLAEQAAWRQGLRKLHEAAKSRLST